MIKGSKKRSTKTQTVYRLTCPETDVEGLVCTHWQEVGDFIAGDIENNENEEKEFTYKIEVQQMTAKQINDLPEYEP